MADVNATAAEWVAAKLDAERAHEQRVVRFIEQALAHGDFYAAASAAIELHLFDEVPPLLYRLWHEGRIAREQLPEAIGEVWIQNPSPVASLGQRRWLELFKEAVAELGGPIVRSVKVKMLSLDGGESTPVTAEYGHLIELPAGPLEVWRGAAPNSACGMSWSVHRDCALGFAQGGADRHDRGALYRAVVPPHGVLALFGDEREQEVVVNPYVVARSRVLVEEVTISAEAMERRDKMLRVFGVEP
jgi:hypothetical protein